MIYLSIGKLSDMFGRDSKQAERNLSAILETMPSGAADYIKSKKGSNIRSKIHTAGGILLLLRILKTENIELPKIKIKSDSYGKPYLDGVSDFDFNISHSGNFAVCAVQTGKNARIGVDIECKAYEESRYHNMAMRYFSTAEAKIIEQSNDKKTEFLRIWTRKEALTKFRGGGLQEILGCLDTTVIATEENIVFDEYKITDDNPDSENISDSDTLYFITLCRRNGTEPAILTQ